MRGRVDIGKQAERMAAAANDRYAVRGDALVVRCAAELVGARPQGRGRFLGILKAGPVDFMGTTANGRAVMFDVKASRDAVRLALRIPSSVKLQQAEILSWGHPQLSDSSGWLTGLLVLNDRTFRWYWLPALWLRTRFDGKPQWGSLRWTELTDFGVELDPFGNPDWLPAAWKLCRGAGNPDWLPAGWKLCRGASL